VFASDLEWLIGIFVTLVAGAIAHIYKRIWEMENRNNEKFHEVLRDAATADDKIWSAHQGLSDRTQKFREDVKEHFGSLAKREDIDMMRRDIQARDNKIMDSINQIMNRVCGGGGR
jgi:cytochrome c556